MPTDHARETVEVAAPFDEVLATIRDVESQVGVDPGDPRGRAARGLRGRRPPGHRALQGVGDRRAPTSYTLSYEHADDGMSWTMVEGHLQTGQEGRYTLARGRPATTSVTYDLTIHHNLPLPGFVRNRVIKGLVSSTLTGLKEHLEG